MEWNYKTPYTKMSYSYAYIQGFFLQIEITDLGMGATAYVR